MSTAKHLHDSFTDAAGRAALESRYQEDIALACDGVVPDSVRGHALVDRLASMMADQHESGLREARAMLADQQRAFGDGIQAGLRLAAEIVMNAPVEPGPVVSPALTEAANLIYDKAREVERESSDSSRVRDAGGASAKQPKASLPLPSLPVVPGRAWVRSSYSAVHHSARMLGDGPLYEAQTLCGRLFWSWRTSACARSRACPACVEALTPAGDASDTHPNRSSP